MRKAMSWKDSLIFPGRKTDKDLVVLLAYFSLGFANYNLFASTIKFLPIFFSCLLSYTLTSTRLGYFSACMFG
jgi:hypothetical protein